MGNAQNNENRIPHNLSFQKSKMLEILSFWNWQGIVLKNVNTTHESP
jgi:hypothetical protein